MQRIEKKYCWLAFGLPAYLMLIICFVLKITPFGDESFLIIDANAQYINFFSYFRTMLQEGNDFFYSFSKTLGGEMAGFTAYYLISPLNLLLLFFPTAYLPEAFSLMVLIKVSLCGLSFFYYINRRYPFHRVSLLFSTSYALMAYNAVYCYNVMWIDCVACLPLILEGIHRLIGRGSPWLYIGSLAAAILMNYYIGYMICIFSALYFVLCMAIQFPLRELRGQWRRAALFAGSSVGAAALNAFLLFPVLLSLDATSKAGAKLSDLKFKENFPFSHLFEKLLSGSMGGEEISYGLPNIFCGVAVLLLACLYFENARIPLREKLASAGLIGFFAVSFHIKALNLIWHGFKTPIWFPYRYSFTFSFFLIALAYRALLCLQEGNTRKQVIGTFLGILAAIILLARKALSFVSVAAVYLDIAVYLLSAILLCLLLQDIRKKAASWLLASLVVLQCLSLTGNAASALKSFGKVKASAFREEVLQVEPAVQGVKAMDASFYRMEKDFQRSRNDAMLYRYNGIGHFSSTEKEFMKTFLSKMGFRNNGNWAHYLNGSTTSVDCLLGVKYLLSKEGTQKPYDFLYADGPVMIYENPLAFPVGFAVDGRIQELALDSPDRFQLQNDIYAALLAPGEAGPVFTAVADIRLQLENLSVQQKEEGATYTRQAAGQPAKLIYHIRSASPGMLYTYITGTKTQAATIAIDGKDLGKYFNSQRWDAVPLGAFEPGSEHLFEIILDEGTQSLEIGEAYFYHEQMQQIEETYRLLQPQFCDLQRLSSSHLTGSVEVSRQGQCLLFTLPYEEGWQIEVDGSLVQPTMVLDALMAVPISPGSHQLQMRYRPRGLLPGIALSLISAALLALFFLCQRRRAAQNPPLPAPEQGPEEADVSGQGAETGPDGPQPAAGPGTAPDAAGAAENREAGDGLQAGPGL